MVQRTTAADRIPTVSHIIAALRPLARYASIAAVVALVVLAVVFAPRLIGGDDTPKSDPKTDKQGPARSDSSNGLTKQQETKARAVALRFLRPFALYTYARDVPAQLDAMEPVTSDGLMKALEDQLPPRPIPAWATGTPRVESIVFAEGSGATSDGLVYVTGVIEFKGEQVAVTIVLRRSAESYIVIAIPDQQLGDDR